MSEVLDIINRAPIGDEMVKAMNDGNQDAPVEPKSAIINPQNALSIGETRGKPTPVPYSTLRRMSQIPAIAAIINTRLNQVARFANRPRYKGDIGFRVTTKNPDAKLEGELQKKARKIEEFFLKTGWEKNRVRKDNFDTFLRKIVRDSLTLDVVTFEKVASLKGELFEVWAMDGATIELVINNPVGEASGYTLPVYKPETRSGMKNVGEIAYVQSINGVTVAEYTEDELAFAIRNPRTDIEFTDFGMSELETLMEIVTGIVNGVRYNTSYFSHSHLPQGVMELVGKYKDTHLQAFQRHWKNLTQGAPGKWSVPVMAMEEGQGFKFTPFKNSNRDMEFNEFLEFLFNVACAVYQIDPNEVGFKSWTSGSTGMSQSDNTAEKMDASKDKGFIPLMGFLANTFNSEIVDLIDDELVFEWVGLDEEDEERKMERVKSRLEAGLSTIAEERKIEDMDEIMGLDGKPAMWTLAPANPQLIQVFMAEMQAQQGGGEEGEGQDPNALDPNALPPEQERKNEVEDAEVDHEREKELMDKKHELTLEEKEHAHKLSQEAQKTAAALAPKPLPGQPAPGGKPGFPGKPGAAAPGKAVAGKPAPGAPAPKGKPAASAPTAKAAPKKDEKDSIQKSIENDFLAMGIVIDWESY